MALERQCRFCTSFDTEYDVELICYSCRRDRFPRADDRVGYPDLAPTCPDFGLDERPGSRWSELQKG